MRAIAELLAALPDNESRARVLRWSADHFYGSPGGSLLPATDDRQRPAASSGGGQQADPALTVGDDVFDTPRRPRETADADDEVPDFTDPDDETVHCDALAVDESVFEREEIKAADLEVDAEVIEPVRPEPRQAGGGLDSLLRDFVADFQRLALEWQTA